MQPLTWLALAWRDMARAGWISRPWPGAGVFGGLIIAVAHDRFWPLAGALSGFLVAPVLATSLYALSRALERGEPASRRCSRPGSTGSTATSASGAASTGAWCCSVLLALAATGWVLTSAALITLLAPEPIRTGRFPAGRGGGPDSLLFSSGWRWAGCWPRRSSLPVVSIPLLLDRRVTLLQAVLTSWRTVLQSDSHGVLGCLIAGFSLLGLGSLLLGLIAVMPMLGASWHAYRDLVDPRRCRGDAAV
jgi:uncharacterized membrane protein